ncbi:MAG: hypothetical protein QXF35_04310 [Candidatus Bilamarchaeaceae archaeon]
MSENNSFVAVFIEETVNFFGKTKGEMLAKEFITFAFEIWNLDAVALQKHKLDFFAPLITYFAKIKQLNDDETFGLINCMRSAKEKANQNVSFVLDKQKEFEKNIKERKRDIQKRFCISKTTKKIIF